MKIMCVKRIRNKKGQAMVEFALVLPLLLLLLFGIIEFGRLMLIYASVSTASREAARWGSAAGGTPGMDNDRYMDCAGMMAAAARVGFFGVISDTDPSIGTN